MNRSYYSASAEKFLNDDNDRILGELTRHHQFSLEDLQRNAWILQIFILKKHLMKLHDCHLAFEYAIPRMGKRVDVVILYLGVVFILEFKVGESKYNNSAKEQALGYSIDLKNFHEQSHNRSIIPIVLATEGSDYKPELEKYPDSVYRPIKLNINNFVRHIQYIANEISENIPINAIEWQVR